MSKELGTLAVVVLKAKNLHDIHSFYKQDPFAQIALNGTTHKTEPDIKGGQHPEWDAEFRFPVYDDKKEKSRVMEISCWRKEPRKDEEIGKGKLDISNTIKTGEFDDWVKIEDSGGVYRGEMYLEMTFFAAGPPPLERRPSRLKPSERLTHLNVGKPSNVPGTRPVGNGQFLTPNYEAPLPPTPEQKEPAKLTPVPTILRPGPRATGRTSSGRGSTVGSDSVGTLMPDSRRSSSYQSLSANTPAIPSSLSVGQPQAYDRSSGGSSGSRRPSSNSPPNNSPTFPGSLPGSYPHAPETLHGHDRRASGGPGDNARPYGPTVGSDVGAYPPRSVSYSPPTNTSSLSAGYPSAPETLYHRDRRPSGSSGANTRPYSPAVGNDVGAYHPGSNPYSQPTNVPGFSSSLSTGYPRAPETYNHSRRSSGGSSDNSMPYSPAVSNDAGGYNPGSGPPQINSPAFPNPPPASYPYAPETPYNHSRRSSGGSGDISRTYSPAVGNDVGAHNPGPSSHSTITNGPPFSSPLPVGHPHAPDTSYNHSRRSSGGGSDSTKPYNPAVTSDLEVPNPGTSSYSPVMNGPAFSSPMPGPPPEYSHNQSFSGGSSDGSRPDSHPAPPPHTPIPLHTDPSAPVGNESPPYQPHPTPVVRPECTSPPSYQQDYSQPSSYRHDYGPPPVNYSSPPPPAPVSNYNHPQPPSCDPPPNHDSPLGFSFPTPQIVVGAIPTSYPNYTSPPQFSPAQIQQAPYQFAPLHVNNGSYSPPQQFGYPPPPATPYSPPPSAQPQPPPQYNYPPPPQPQSPFHFPPRGYEPELPDPHLLTRYSTPLPLPPGGSRGSYQPPPKPPTPTSPVNRYPSQSVQSTTHPQKTQEEIDAELARQLDMELNLDVAPRQSGSADPHIPGGFK